MHILSFIGVVSRRLQVARFLSVCVCVCRVDRAIHLDLRLDFHRYAVASLTLAAGLLPCPLGFSGGGVATALACLPYTSVYRMESGDQRQHCRLNNMN